MNRDQAVSFGDPMPMRLGKALTKEDIEKRAKRQTCAQPALGAAYGTGVLAGGGPLHESTDAQRWAITFAALFSVKLANGLPAGDDTQGLMLGWFANAIEAGRSAGLRQAQESAQQEAAKAKPAGAWPFPEHCTPVGLHE
jgi:hypothetical protein